MLNVVPLLVYSLVTSLDESTKLVKSLSVFNQSKCELWVLFISSGRIRFRPDQPANKERGFRRWLVSCILTALPHRDRPLPASARCRDGRRARAASDFEHPATDFLLYRQVAA